VNHKASSHKLNPAAPAAGFCRLGDLAEILFFLDNFFIFALTFLDLLPICSLARIRGLCFPPWMCQKQLDTSKFADGEFLSSGGQLQNCLRCEYPETYGTQA